jgi:hypothetical protein
MEMCTCVVIVEYKGILAQNPNVRTISIEGVRTCADMPKEGGTTVGASRGAVIVGRKRALGPIGVGDETQEF